MMNKTMRQMIVKLETDNLKAVSEPMLLRSFIRANVMMEKMMMRKMMLKFETDNLEAISKPTLSKSSTRETVMKERMMRKMTIKFKTDNDKAVSKSMLTKSVFMDFVRNAASAMVRGTMASINVCGVVGTLHDHLATKPRPALRISTSYL